MNLANMANAVFVTFQLPAKMHAPNTGIHMVPHKSYRAFYKTILIVCSILMAFCACWQAGSSQSVLFHDGGKMFQKLRISSGVNLVILSDRLFITETQSFIDLLAGCTAVTFHIRTRQSQ